MTKSIRNREFSNRENGITINNYEYTSRFSNRTKKQKNRPVDRVPYYISAQKDYQLEMNNCWQFISTSERIRHEQLSTSKRCDFKNLRIYLPAFISG